MNSIHQTYLRLCRLIIGVACGFFLTSADRLSAGVHHFADSSALAEGRWVKIALAGEEDGIYQIPYSQLRKMGFTRPEQVGVYGFGGHMLDESFSSPHIDDLPEVAVCHDAARQRILFFGRGLITWHYQSASLEFTHRRHPYATQSCYFLREKEGEVRRPDTLSSASSLDVRPVSSYHERLLHETENTNIGKMGRELYGESFLYTQSQKFPFSFYRHSNDSLRVTLNFVTKASSSSTISAVVNEQSLGKATLSAAANSYVQGTEATLNKLLTACSGDDVTVRLTYTPSSSKADLAMLNYIRCQALCDLALDGRSYLLFRHSDAAQYRLHYRLAEPLRETEQLWDVTSPVDVCLQETVEGGFIPQELGIREYAWVDLASSDFPGVTSLGVVENQNLHAVPQADFVIIAPAAFRSHAETLADYRRANDGLEVLVVSPEAIYNEFSSGVPDATAYRLFCKMLYDRGLSDPSGRQLRYLLLFGDGHYNNRHLPSANYLLCYESEHSLVETSSFVCDDYFGFLDDNEGGRIGTDGRYTLHYDDLDIGVGRFPVRTTDEATAVLDKTLAYSSNRYYGNWKNRITFLGDDDKEGDAENCHMKHCDSLVHILQRAGHDEYIYKKIFLDAYTMRTTASGTDYPDARKEFSESLQQGTLLVNYAGHGSTTALTHENIVSTATASSLRMKQLPIWITATCDFARFDNDDTSCGETLLLNPQGGAAALFTTTRVVYASQNLSLNVYMIRNLFKRLPDGSRYRLGDILKESKRSLRSDYNKLNFCLLGDPSMTMTYPEHEMELTAINGETVTPNTAVTLPAMSRVTMRGRVLKVGTQQTDTAFHGLVYPTLFDAEETISTLCNNAWTENSFSFQTRTKKVFNGRDIVRNGEFEFSFVVPQDISYTSGKGLVNLYACSEDGVEGNGSFTDLFLSGTADNIAADTLGPKIRSLFLNRADFKSGDCVNVTPYFYAEVQDSSGFNMTGNSIGHDLTLSIKNLSNPLIENTQYTLNNYFTTYTGDPTTGNVRFSIPKLEEGEYEATFRVWDVYNNSSSQKFSFKVGEKDVLQAVWVQAYPSPVYAGESVTFRIMHDRPESATTLQVQIFTETGVKVWEASTTESAAEVAFVTDQSRPYNTDDALNADETQNFLGTSSVVWNGKGIGGATLSPGLYIYRVYLSCGGTYTASESKKLLILGNNKSK